MGGVGSVLQQFLHDSCVVALDCVGEGGLTLDAHVVGVCLVPQQQLNYLHISIKAGLHKRRLLLVLADGGFDEVGIGFQEFGDVVLVLLVDVVGEEVGFGVKRLVITHQFELLSFVYTMFIVNDEYDTRKKNRGYQRKLSLLKQISDGQLVESQESMLPQSLPEELIPSIVSRATIQGLERPEVKKMITRMKAQQLAKVFVDKLRVHRLSSVHNPVHLDSMHVKDTKKRISPIEIKKKEGWKGLQNGNRLKLVVAFISIITIFYLQILSSFHWFLQDFRENESGHAASRAMLLLCFIFIVLKMLMSVLFTTTINGIQLVYIRQIAFNYLTSKYILLDLSILLTVILFAAWPDDIFPAIVGYWATLFNLIYMQRLDELIEVMLINSPTQKHYFSLFRLLLFNVFIAHLIATFFLGLGSWQEGNGNSWMFKYNNIQSSNRWVKYLYSFYWAVTIIVTVGFGDITISNVGEAVFVSFVMLTGCLMFAYNISEIGRIFSLLNESGIQMRNELSVLRRLARVTDMSEELHNQIAEYIIHSSVIKNMYQIQERRALIRKLPQQMREEFQVQSSQKFFKHVPFFWMLRTDTKVALLAKSSFMIMAPKQYVTHKVKGLTNISILVQGQVAMTFKKPYSALNGIPVEYVTVQDESFRPELLNKKLLEFGEEINYDIVCTEYCRMTLINFDNFNQVLKQSSKDFEFYSQLKDCHNFRQIQKSRDLCQHCDSKHSLFVCPKLHFIPLKSLVYLRHQQNGMRSKTHQYDFTFIRQKKKVAQTDVRRLWKYLFKPIEGIYQIQAEKAINRRVRAVEPENDTEVKKWKNIETSLLKNLKEDDFGLDKAHDYEFYFIDQNPRKFFKKSLKVGKRKSGLVSRKSIV